jgi:squalene-hopene/tetraprenyl-beta-curcumene cyclase
VLGLLAAGERESPRVRRGVQFLLDRQTPAGTWPEEATTGTGFPNVFYLTYGMYRDYFPLLALSQS